MYWSEIWEGSIQGVKKGGICKTNLQNSKIPRSQISISRKGPFDKTAFLISLDAFCSPSLKVSAERIKHTEAVRVVVDSHSLFQNARAWHLSYHDGEHYNSVRLADDYKGPAQPIALVAGKVCAQPNGCPISKWEQQQLDTVRWGTGCEDIDRINLALDSSNGSADAVGSLSAY